MDAPAPGDRGGSNPGPRIDPPLTTILHDCRVNGMPRPLFVHALGSDGRTRDATIALLQILRCQQDRVIDRGAGLRPYPSQGGSKLLLVASEIGENRDITGEGKDGGSIIRL